MHLSNLEIEESGSDSIRGGVDTFVRRAIYGHLSHDL